MSFKSYEIHTAVGSVLLKVLVVCGCLTIVVIVANAVVLYFKGNSKNECIDHAKKELSSLCNTVTKPIIESMKFVLGVK